jgi:hypothetical protein
MKIGRLEFLWKDAGSNTGNCPSLSRAPLDGRDGYVINGIRVDEAIREQIPHAGAGEGAVWVPANVLDRLPEQR